MAGVFGSNANANCPHSRSRLLSCVLVTACEITVGVSADVGAGDDEDDDEHLSNGSLSHLKSGQDASTRSVRQTGAATAIRSGSVGPLSSCYDGQGSEGVEFDQW